jgi:hypothetical protein
MARVDDDPFGMAPPKKPATHEIGQPLDTLSVDELDERVALLKAEIIRLEEAKVAKQASKLAADAVFKS